MNRSTMVIISITATLAFALPAIAQDQNSGATQANTVGVELGRVERGNTTIVFESPGRSDLDTNRLQTWDQFAEAHPKIARTLAFHPKLMNDQAYLSKHSELAEFFEAHPDIKGAMAKNPGNFVAIPPRAGE
jgi:hypothetical protein